MSFDAIARRYARAIFELAKEDRAVDAVASHFVAFADTYLSSSDLRVALASPLVDDASKLRIVSEIANRLGMGQLATNSVRLMTQRRRLRALPDVARHLKQMVDSDGNIVRANVTSAIALSEVYVHKLKTELERSTGKRVELTLSVDPALIAGVVTQVGDRVVDGSLRTRLETFQHSRFQFEGSSP